MAISERLGAFLRASNIKYTTAKHPVVYTAQEIAAVQHVPGRQLAKCILVNTERGPTLAVLSAMYRIDLANLKTALGVRMATLAKESDIKERFPDVEVGAMSPFGNLYQIPVVVDRTLGESEEIVCNAGSHTETLKMRYRDFATLVKPKVGNFVQPVSGPKVKATSRKPARAGRARAKGASPRGGRAKQSGPSKPRARRR